MPKVIYIYFYLIYINEIVHSFMHFSLNIMCNYQKTIDCLLNDTLSVIWGFFNYVDEEK